jgi:hypothetical protein
VRFYDTSGLTYDGVACAAPGLRARERSHPAYPIGFVHDSAVVAELAASPADACGARSLLDLDPPHPDLR